MKHFIFAILSLSLCTACQHSAKNKPLNEEAFLRQAKVKWENAQFQTIHQEASRTQFRNAEGVLVHFNVLSLADYGAAVEHLMNRRLEIQRLYELSSEPYFGTPDESDCRSNIQVHNPVKTENAKAQVSFLLLANRNLALGDCLLSNNEYRLQSSFLVCHQFFVETKVFIPKTLSAWKSNEVLCP